jgi:hypothetical protein
MNTQSQIDATLRLIGSAKPPSGLEQRVTARLNAPRRKFTVVHSLSVLAIAASLAIAVLALAPLTRELAPHHTAGSLVPRVTVPAKGAFGAASAVRVPTAPLPVPPAPVNHGRGHTRSGRATLPAGSRAPLAAGVAIPRQMAARQAAEGAAVSTAPKPANTAPTTPARQ